LRTRSPRAAGLCWGYAAASHIFPALLLVGYIVHGIWFSVRERRISDHHLRLVSTAAVFIVLSLLMSLAVGDGIYSWVDWIHAVRTHLHQVDPDRIGLRHLFMVRAGTMGLGVADPVTLVDKSLWMYGATAAALFIPAILSVRRLDEVSASLLLAGVAFVVFVAPEKHYMAFLCLFFLVTFGHRKDHGILGDRGLTLFAALLFLTAAAQNRFFVKFADADAARGIYNVTTSASFVVLVLLFDVFLVVRLKLWRKGEMSLLG
jgi:hypothetical protein